MHHLAAALGDGSRWFVLQELCALIYLHIYLAINKMRVSPCHVTVKNLLRTVVSVTKLLFSQWNRCLNMSDSRVYFAFVTFREISLLCVHRKYLIFLFKRSKNKHELVLSQNVKLKKRCWSPDRPPGANDHAPHRESGEENSARRQHDQTGKQVKTGPLSSDLCKTVAKHCLRLRTTVTKRCDRKGWNKKKKGVLPVWSSSPHKPPPVNHA